MVETYLNFSFFLSLNLLLLLIYNSSFRFTMTNNLYSHTQAGTQAQGQPLKEDRYIITLTKTI